MNDILWLVGGLLILQISLTLVQLMKTAELNASVAGLSASVTTLSASVDAAVVLLGNLTDVTPDGDVVAAITAIDTQTSALNAANAKLVAVLAPAPAP